MSAAALLVPVVLIRRKRQDLILSDKEQFLIDDDEYWKSGWYSNPDDPHLFVPDRMSDMNFAMNMARPAAKAICIATAAVTIAALVFAAAVYLHFSAAEVNFVRDEDTIEISAAGYKCEFSLQEVRSAELLYEMPKDKFRRTNGASTDEYNIGHFRGKEIGKCMMFLYNRYEPILKIRLEDKTVFVNSRQSEQTESWLALLGRKQS